LTGLIEGTSTERVSTDDARFETALLIMDCKLCAGGGFAVSL
jgi:hypothetical protein